jgi:hypothetical protein
MFCILMATPPPEDDEDAAAVEDEAAGVLEPLLVELLSELPQPAAARAPIAHRASGILLMSITTPPRVDPS